jgi:hypothetical protein
MSIAQVEIAARALQTDSSNLGAVQMHVRQHAPHGPRAERHRPIRRDGSGSCPAETTKLSLASDSTWACFATGSARNGGRPSCGSANAAAREQVVVHLHDDPRPGVPG